MTSLVDIVRPFQTRDVTPPALSPSSDVAQTPSDVVITLGENGNPKICDYSLNSTTTAYLKHTPKERKSVRKTHTKRITNPTDPSQYVDVEVIDEMGIYNPQTTQESSLTIKNNDDDDDSDLP